MAAKNAPTKTEMKAADKQANEMVKAFSTARDTAFEEEVDYITKSTPQEQGPHLHVVWYVKNRHAAGPLGWPPRRPRV